jgi:hypothetical protein
MIKGKLNITRVSSTKGGDFIRIVIEDDTARVRAIQCDVSLEAFAKALTGQGMLPCDFEVPAPELVGTIGENKVEKVVLDQRYSSPGKEEAERKALEPYCVDGWYPRRGDISNHHYTKSNKDGTVTVTVVFFRNVRQDGTPVILDAE